MLTADLALSYQRGDKINPRYIDVQDPRELQTAADLLLLVQQHAGARRAELQTALDEYIGVGTDYKILRGLIKLILDRCVFESRSVREPLELRRLLFAKAVAQHPVLTAAAREQILTAVAGELVCSPAEIVTGLYADLAENQVLTAFDEIGAAELLDRYNLAQAQALLYRSTEMRLWLAAEDVHATRALFQAIKSYRLIHEIRGNPRTGYEVRLSGPVSLFHRSQRYGIQLAVFLPALLLQTGWTMRAEVEGKRGKAYFELDSTQRKLRSHYLREEVNPTAGLLEKLVQDWAALGSAWTVAANQAVLNFGETALVPDLVFQHPEFGKVHLELLGFWTPRFLKDRLLMLERGQVGRYLLVVIEELRCSREAPTSLPPHVLTIKSALKAKEVLKRLEQLTAADDAV
jgi:predicted nuclease of restriction endonuclease-like RecB superfamily